MKLANTEQKRSDPWLIRFWAAPDWRRSGDLAQPPMIVDVHGRTVLTAGASRGMGATTARLAAEAGARMIVHGRTPSAPLLLVACSLGATAIACDETAVRRAVAGLEVDALICALGSMRPTPAIDGDTEDRVSQFRSNMPAPAHFIRAIAPAMRRRGYGRVATAWC